jgi:hypothetical protein
MDLATTELTNNKPYSNRRNHTRRSCFLPAVIKLGSAKISDCIVKDISATGARILIPNGIWEPSGFVLDIGPSIGAVNVSKVWSSKGMMGVKFSSIIQN